MCIAVVSDVTGSDHLTELKELLRTAGVAVAGELVQRRSHPDPNVYLGKGKMAELRQEIERSNANLIACDDELKPRQERNLEEATGVPVVDRTAVILDIFADHASTAEGKLQVELAQLEYNLARMRGLWTHLERLGGGIGTRGPGETQIETDRRLARDRIAQLKRKLATQQRRHHLMRAERMRASLPNVSLAGYTNAGKSTLLNALTGANVAVGERLFQTLDPTTRSFVLNGRTYLLTDTVGFIRKLPHQLIAAFRATLVETVEADLILHIVDASTNRDNLMEMVSAVDGVLEEIGAGSIPRLLVLNKTDLLDPNVLEDLGFMHTDCVAVSAAKGTGIQELNRLIELELGKTWQPVELLVPYEEGSTLSDLHRLAGNLLREDTPSGVRVTAQLPAELAKRFNRYRIYGRPTRKEQGAED